MKTSILILLLLYSCFSIAGAGTFAFNQVGVLKDNDKVYALIQIDGELPLAPECAAEYKHQISFLIEDELGKLFYTNALTAVTAQKNVYLHYSENECGLWGSRPIATRIDLKK
ncbi:hypothetical protein P886_1984 [Alteromonadaceae bacterium 2753L.S.0a.02]|nr:hypothetical protein P886_1984 [Alteromonadaceae bacterium 2753L.S.0a.02]